MAKTKMGLTLVMLGALALLALGSPALAKDGDVLVRGTCTAKSAAKLKLSSENSRIEVEVEVGDDVRLRVVDDGIGPPTGPTPDGKGLANMAARAQQRGGSLDLRQRQPRGTILEWRVPRT